HDYLSSHLCFTVPDEHLLSLKFIFGSSAVQALDLVDRQSITLISSPSGRRVYQETEMQKNQLLWQLGFVTAVPHCLSINSGPHSNPFPLPHPQCSCMRPG
uniref:Uncharacterized protein n=1 Tax=Ursus maritimus TaxID=29073 RepID=A0A452TLD2_URSMA